MADTFFIGGTGVFETDANWSGVHPAIGDNAIWDGRTNINCTDDNHTSLAEKLGDLMIEPQYTGMIGTSGAPLQCAATSVQMRGSGTLYHDNGSVTDTDRIIINNPSCHAFLGADTAKSSVIEALAGNVTLTATLTGTDEVWVGDANVTIAGGNTIALVRMFGSGNVTCLPAVTLLENLGTGTFTQLPLAVGAVATMRIGAGAKVIYQAASTPITLVNIHNGGSLDVTGARAVLTITTLWRGPRSAFRKSSTTIVGTENTI